jgi:hypothetical protein
MSLTLVMKLEGKEAFSSTGNSFGFEICSFTCTYAHTPSPHTTRSALVTHYHTTAATAADLLALHCSAAVGGRAQSHKSYPIEEEVDVDRRRDFRRFLVLITVFPQVLTTQHTTTHHITHHTTSRVRMCDG